MQKTAWIVRHRTCSSLAWIALICVASVIAVAQDTTPTSSSATLPTDPQALLILASQSNGLYADDLQPWHLKASIDLIDKNGKTTEQGSYEVFWAGPKKLKRMYTTAGSTQTDYVTETGTFRTGEDKSSPSMLGRIFESWLHPIPNETQIQKYDLAMKQQEIGGTKLTCITLKRKPDNHELTASAGQLFCLSPEKPILRVSSAAMPTSQAPAGAIQTVFNKTVLFQGRYISSDLRVNGTDGEVLKAHIESLEKMPVENSAELTPPPEAKLAPATVDISTAVATGMLLKLVVPKYPAAAMSLRSNGTVVVDIVIGKDGHVYNPKIINGPDVLQQAALDAIKQWIYKPYLLNGEPIEVHCMVNVMFNVWK